MTEVYVNVIADRLGDDPRREMEQVIGLLFEHDAAPAPDWPHSSRIVINAASVVENSEAERVAWWQHRGGSICLKP